MEVKIKNNNGMIDATIEMVDGVMVVSPISKFGQNGDVVAVDDGSQIFIVRSMIPACKNTAICYFGVDFKDNKLIFENDICLFTRPATEDEKQKLFDKLLELGYEWNPSLKKLFNLKWKPKEGELFFHPYLGVDLQFKPSCTTYHGSDVEKSLIDNDWGFERIGECQEFCNKLNEAINSVKS